MDLNLALPTGVEPVTYGLEDHCDYPFAPRQRKKVEEVTTLILILYNSSNYRFTPS